MRSLPNCSFSCRPEGRCSIVGSLVWLPGGRCSRRRNSSMRPGNGASLPSPCCGTRYQDDLTLYYLGRAAEGLGHLAGAAELLPAELAIFRHRARLRQIEPRLRRGCLARCRRGAARRGRPSDRGIGGGCGDALAAVQPGGAAWGGHTGRGARPGAGRAWGDPAQRAGLGTAERSLTAAAAAQRAARGEPAASRGAAAAPAASGSGAAASAAANSRISSSRRPPAAEPA